MKPIPTKLKFTFNNVIVRDKSGGWKTLADVEGNLTITLGANVFFNEEYMLLLELSVALSRWVKKIECGQIQNFYYESMDYEEKLILSFIENDHNT